MFFNSSNETWDILVFLESWNILEGLTDQKLQAIQFWKLFQEIGKKFKISWRSCHVMSRPIAMSYRLVKGGKSSQNYKGSNL